MVWGWMLFEAYAIGTRTLSWFGHGCFGNRMHSYHGRYHGSAMDALEIVCARTTDVIMVWPWMLWFDRDRALKFSIPIYICTYICVHIFMYLYM